MLRPLTTLPQRVGHHHHVLPPLSRLRRAEPLRRAQKVPNRRYASTATSEAGSMVQQVGTVTQDAATTHSLDTLTHILRLPLDYLHDTLHLPYIWVIPLAAFTIRAALFFPITLTTRKALQRRMALSPLISAHKPWYRQEALDLARRDPSRKSPQVHQWRLMRQLTKKLNARWDAGLGKTFFLPMLQLPVFLGMSWTIRDMLNLPGGSLKALIYGMFGKEVVAASDVAATSASTSAAEPATAIAPEAATTMTDGLPWATNLAAADPTGILSYTVSAIMLAQTLLSGRSMGGSTMLSRLLIVLSLCIGPLMASAPAGILYYWACSSGMALITNVFLDWRYPMMRFRPCKRPLVGKGVPGKRELAMRKARLEAREKGALQP